MKKLVFLAIVCFLTMGISISNVMAGEKGFMAGDPGYNPGAAGYDPGYKFFNPFNWWDEVPTITVRNPFDKGYWSSTGIMTITLRDLSKFYNHCGPGVTQGLRLCIAAGKRLYKDGMIIRGDLRVVTGDNHGPAAVIEYITNAVYGKPLGKAGVWFNGKMVYDTSIGKYSFIFYRKSTGKAIKLTLKLGVPPKEMRELKKKQFAGKKLTPEQVARMKAMARKWAFRTMIMLEKELLEIEELKDFNWNVYFKKAYGG